MNDLRSVTVYCGSNPGADPAYAEAARALARLLASSDIRIVYGGGHVGLMGVLADTAMAAGGEVVGVIPQALIDREIGHRGLNDLRVVSSMHERKALMAELGDAFIALPGGIGTLEELIEVYTWSQLGMHRKPLGVLNVNGYYDALATFLDGGRARFMRPQPRGADLRARPETLLARLAAPSATAGEVADRSGDVGPWWRAGRSTTSTRARSRTRTATASATSPASVSGCRIWPGSASTRCRCRRSTSPPWPTSATTSPITATSTRCSGRSRTSTRWRPKRTGSACG